MSEDGYTLVEALVAASLMLVIFVSSLAAFGSFSDANASNVKLEDAQDRARTALDYLARELRNLASPTVAQSSAVDRATAYDLVFLTVDRGSTPSGQNTAATSRVRYCLSPANAATGSVLYRQTQTWTTASPPAIPANTACPSPDAAWTKTRAVADHLVNVYGGQSRPVFTFDTSTVSQITWIVPQLFLDLTPGKPPAETTLRTGIYLRNQNRAPTAAFTSRMVSAANGSAHMVLNGSASSDPEGGALTYVWYDGSTKIASCPSLVVCDTTLSGTGTHSLTLTVLDSAGLSASTPAQSVSVP